jgi:hypothetical protein
MLSKFISAAVLLAAPGGPCFAAGHDESEIREFLARWNKAYTDLHAAALAALETPDYEMVDRFGDWIKSEGPEFNQRLWGHDLQRHLSWKTRACSPDLRVFAAWLLRSQSCRPVPIISTESLSMMERGFPVLGNRHLHTGEDRRRLACRAAQYSQSDQPGGGGSGTARTECVPPHSVERDRAEWAVSVTRLTSAL